MSGQVESSIQCQKHAESDGLMVETMGGAELEKGVNRDWLKSKIGSDRKVEKIDRDGHCFIPL
jgi:hypothetical protein